MKYVVLDMVRNFNPRSPHGERHGLCTPCAYFPRNFNPRSPHGERHYLPVCSANCPSISIHAPRTGSDGRVHRPASIFTHFNPRSPHGERLGDFCTYIYRCRFQSTLPARGATGTISVYEFPRTISIHAPRTGSDVSNIRGFSAHDIISIHAPRTGSDSANSTGKKQQNYFNPRSPHGERHFQNIGITPYMIFQSTLPARGATPPTPAATLPAIISIHAPRTGSDLAWSDRRSFRAIFQSTLPARGATLRDNIPIRAWLFQSTLPARGATWS